MTSVLPKMVADVGPALFRFSVDDYHRLLEVPGLFDGKRVELIEGVLVEKLTHDPPHDSTVQAVDDLLTALLPPGWRKRVRLAITLSDSEPEPDVCLARGDRHTYRTHHPGPADIGLVIEVADTSLRYDRQDKARAYARAGIAVYWVVNLIDRQVEVYTQPSGPAAAPAYAHRQDYQPGGSVPVVLEGVTVGAIAVNEILP